MKVGISAFASDGGKSGISVYMIQMFKRMARLAPQDSFVLFMAEADRPFLDPCLKNVEIVTSPNWVGHPLVSILWHLIVLPLVLRKHHCDCVFMPAGNRRLAWFYGVPSVGTVHDMSQLHVPAKYDAFRMFYIMRVLPFMMRCLTRVIAISESTKKDLVGYAKVEPARIDVVYNGVGLEAFSMLKKEEAKQRISSALAIPTDFILYLSRLEHPGKNHVRLIEAFSRLKKNGDVPHKLVLVGSRWAGSEPIDEAVRAFDMEDEVIFPGFVPNELMSDLYAAADIFVFPSLFEGFGIPLVEAMASGTVVCASNTSSLPEVVGDAGLLFDPEDVAAIEQAMHTLLSNQGLRQEFQQKGLLQAKKFSFEDAAKATLRLCREVVQ